MAEQSGQNRAARPPALNGLEPAGGTSAGLDALSDQNLLQCRKDRSWIRRFFLRKLGILLSDEIIYQNMFVHAASNLGCSALLFPTKSAANYSLLYVVLRIITETEAKSVLDLGAGQTTVLLDALRKTHGLDIATIEHDNTWAERTRNRVSHDVIEAKLAEKTIFGHDALAYDLRDRLGDRRFDLMVVDGPPGVSSRSRWGCLDLFERHMKDEFVVIFDDAERRGEGQTVDFFIDLLRKRSIQHYVGFTRAIKSQIVVGTEKYAGVAYF